MKAQFQMDIILVLTCLKIIGICTMIIKWQRWVKMQIYWLLH